VTGEPGRYDLSLLSPADAAVAVRSFPRRFRELLERARRDGDERAAALVRDRALETATALGAAARRLGGPAGAGSVDVGPGDDLDGLAAEAEHLAAAVDRVRDWDEGDALQVLRDAVQAGSGKVRDAERAVLDDG